MKKTHAFTLIELLVVISIIAILAGFAMPVFSRAIEKGRATECKNNLGNIGKGILTYMNDSDGTMFALDSKDSWPTLIQAKYVKDWKSFRSPFDKPTATRPAGDTAPVPVSYGLNEKIFDTFEGKWKTSGSALILGAPAIDVAVTGKTVVFIADAFSDKQVKIAAPAGDHLGTHGSRDSINVLFADGHVVEMDWGPSTKKGAYSDTSSEIGKQRWDPAYDAPEKN